MSGQIERHHLWQMGEGYGARCDRLVVRVRVRDRDRDRDRVRGEEYGARCKP